jgi:eukaryotic-like serine/threonine-protein kinase
MTPELHRRIGELYHGALELAPEARPDFLFRACAGDDELRREVESLLRANEESDNFISAEIAGVAAEMAEQQQNPSLAPELIGQSISNYQVLSLLGKGGMSEVYLAEDIRLGRKVALKLLPSAFTHDQERLRRFEREARLVSALNHPNILTIYEIGVTSGAHFIATEFVDGQTLRERLRSGRLELDESLEIAIQITTALAAAHEAGIIHRDIKPENVMLRHDGAVKVLDFGLAKLTESQVSAEMNAGEAVLRTATTEAGRVLGTPQYMSPEQARGQEADARSDIFSFGVVLYEMLSGDPPFSGRTAIEMMTAILYREPAPLPSRLALPDELERFITQALHKDRVERYQTSKELLSDLKKLRHELEFQADLERLTNSGAHAVASQSGQSKSGQSKSSQRLAQSAPIKINNADQPGLQLTSGSATRDLALPVAPSKRSGQALWLALAALITVGLGFGLYQFIAPSRNTTKPTAKITPLTTLPGEEFRAAFSPDGNQLAFDWNGEKGDNYDIYTKLVDDSALRRLTTHPNRDFGAVWSPDGRNIAFLRSLYPDRVDDAMELYLVSSYGGAERRLVEGIQVKQNASLSWSPDGKFLAFADGRGTGGADSIFFVEIATGAKRRLTEPPAQIDGDATPTFSPDGRQVAFVRGVTSSVTDIYLVPIAGGEPKRLIFDKANIRGLAWTPAGNEIIFASQRRGISSLWRIGARGGEPELVEAIGAAAQYPAISPHGDRLAFTRLINDTNIYRTDLTAPASRRPAGAQFIASTLDDDSPQYSPDGKSVVFGSTRSGSPEIWLCDSEGGQLRQLTNLGGPLVGTPRWSPDSQQIAFDSRSEGNADIHVISVAGGAARRLTTELAEDVVPSWSNDGRWIYFCSSRGGEREIYKIPAQGGPAVQVTTQGGFEGFESGDGQFLYYTKNTYDSTLWRIPVTGGQQTLAFNSDQKIYRRGWTLANQGIHFASSESVIEFFNPATGKTTPVTTTEKKLARWIPSLAVSPDGKHLLYTQIDQQGSDLMLMENFH